MNLFYSSHCPIESANNMCKVHINKQYQESIQLLSTALQLTGVVDPDLPKPTHQNHPSAVWVRQSIQHYNWLVAHTKALRSLYWKESHGYDKYLDAVLSHTPNLPDIGFTTPPKCINTTEFPELKHDIVFSDVTVCYKKYLKIKYNHWLTRTDKRKIKVEFVNGVVPEYMGESV